MAVVLLWWRPMVLILVEKCDRSYRAVLTLGLEHADLRRFKAKSWITAPSITTNSVNEAVKTLQGYLKEFDGEYVRIIGVDPQAKKTGIPNHHPAPGGVRFWG